MKLNLASYVTESYLDTNTFAKTVDCKSIKKSIEELVYYGLLKRNNIDFDKTRKEKVNSISKSIIGHNSKEVTN